MISITGERDPRMVQHTTRPDDPPPLPPEKPLPSDCCEGGCDPCVFESYEEALAHYRDELARWKARREAGEAR
jgi:hypothetical protein